MPHIVCPNCHATNRLPNEKMPPAHQPICGKCKASLFPGNPLEVNEEDFFKHIQKCDLPIIVDFWAPWCGPCKIFAPVFAQTATQFSHQAQFIKVNTEQQQTLARHFQIRSIPTLMIFKQGQKITEQAGALPAPQFAAWIKQFL